MITDKEFTGFHEGLFKSYFERYIEFKRGQGEKVDHSKLVRLRALNNKLNQYCPSLEISSDAAEAILRERDGEHPATRVLRISDLRQFSSFLNGYGIRSFQIPLKYAKRVHNSFHPYIFSETELRTVTEIADKYRNSIRRNDNINIYPIIIRILIGTGMRIGEVLSLQVKDINMITMSFTVHRAKNNVSRHVPMSPSLTTVITQYLSDIPHRNQPYQPLFLSNYTGSYCSYETIRRNFKKLFALAGIMTPQGGLPRIHDIRHTFCTMSLSRMLTAGSNLYVAVPILAAYVGHVNLCDTERYIHFTEQGYNDFIVKQRELRTLIPEVANHEV